MVVPAKQTLAVLLGILVVSALGCASSRTEEGKGGMEIPKDQFGKTPDGTPVELYTLTNRNRVVAKVMTYGATLTEMHVPDKDGKLVDVTLGFDSLDQYLSQSPYFGCTTGRVANRIANGKFTLDGREYTLATNNGPNHLHGGIVGLDKVVWKAEPMQTREGPAVKFTHTSPDMHEGYPGNLDITVIYTLTNKNELKIDYEATTDKPTPVNLTNHAYWNLCGGGDVLSHELMINADRYTPTDETLIPTGEIAPVAGTPLDFRSPKPIGRDITRIQADPQGYDHNLVLNGRGMKLAARAKCPQTGIVMEIRTTEPGVQFYSGNFLDGTLTGKNGQVHNKHAGFCLETQHFPDSPNKPDFPSIILRPGETYTQTTIHRFSAQ